MKKRKTLLAMGAHYDDCVFGIAGTMLKALRKDYRVVILNLIGDYRNYPPVRKRQVRFVRKAVEISRGFGAEMRFLNFASGELELNRETKKSMAKVVAEVKPDIAFYLWPEDHHPDHVVAAAICRAALHLSGRILNRNGFRSAEQVYAYDNGPRHTIGFEPDTFVDIGDDWQGVLAWVGAFGALQRNVPYDPTFMESGQRSKEVLAAYRGETCGVRYAEAFRATRKSPVEIL